MSVKSVEPALLGCEGFDLEDITHGCVRCGTELIRTISIERTVSIETA